MKFCNVRLLQKSIHFKFNNTHSFLGEISTNTYVGNNILRPSWHRYFRQMMLYYIYTRIYL